MLIYASECNVVTADGICYTLAFHGNDMSKSGVHCLGITYRHWLLASSYVE